MLRLLRHWLLAAILGLGAGVQSAAQGQEFLGRRAAADMTTPIVPLSVRNNAAKLVNFASSCNKTFPLDPGQELVIPMSGTGKMFFVVPDGLHWDCRYPCDKCFYIAPRITADGTFLANIGFGANIEPEVYGGVAGVEASVSRSGLADTVECTEAFCDTGKAISGLTNATFTISGPASSTSPSTSTSTSTDTRTTTGTSSSTSGSSTSNSSTSTTAESSMASTSTDTSTGTSARTTTGTSNSTSNSSTSNSSTSTTATSSTTSTSTGTSTGASNRTSTTNSGSSSSTSSSPPSTTTMSTNTSTSTGTNTGTDARTSTSSSSSNGTTSGAGSSSGTAGSTTTTSASGTSTRSTGGNAARAAT